MHTHRADAEVALANSANDFQRAICVLLVQQQKQLQASVRSEERAIRATLTREQAKAFRTALAQDQPAQDAGVPALAPSASSSGHRSITDVFELSKSEAPAPAAKIVVAKAAAAAPATDSSPTEHKLQLPPMDEPGADPSTPRTVNAAAREALRNLYEDDQQPGQSLTPREVAAASAAAAALKVTVPSRGQVPAHAPAEPVSPPPPLVMLPKKRIEAKPPKSSSGHSSVSGASAASSDSPLTEQIVQLQEMVLSYQERYFDLRKRHQRLLSHASNGDAAGLAADFAALESVGANGDDGQPGSPT